MAPLDTQIPSGDDPMSTTNMHRAEAARRARVAEQTTSDHRRVRANRPVEAATEPGIKIPYSWIRGAWDAVRPHVLKLIGGAGLMVLVTRGQASERAPSLPPTPAEIRVQKVEDDSAKLAAAFEEHLRADKEHRKEEDRRWTKTDEALAKITDYLLNHK